MTSDQKNFAKARLVVPENKLKKKVGHGGFDAASLERAQTMLENNNVDFRPLAQDLLDKLRSALGEMRTERSEDVSDRISFPIMQLKAQGALFHYPFISDISNTLSDFIDDHGIIDEDALAIVEAYHRSISAILLLQLKSSDNKEALSLSKALSDAINRYKIKKGLVR